MSKEELDLVPKSERDCFNPFCNNSFLISEYFDANKGKSKEALEKLWNNPDVQLFCCSCNSKAIQNKLMTFLESLKSNKSEDSTSNLHQLMIDFRGTLTNKERLELIDSTFEFLYEYFDEKEPLDFNVVKVELKGVECIFSQNYELD